MPHFDGKGEADAAFRRSRVPTTFFRASYGVSRAGDELIGETVGVAGDHRTGEEMARDFAEALGEEVTYAPPTFEQYRPLGFPERTTSGTCSSSTPTSTATSSERGASSAPAA